MTAVVMSQQQSSDKPQGVPVPLGFNTWCGTRGKCLLRGNYLSTVRQARFLPTGGRHFSSIAVFAGNHCVFRHLLYILGLRRGYAEGQKKVEEFVTSRPPARALLKGNEKFGEWVVPVSLSPSSRLKFVLFATLQLNPTHVPRNAAKDSSRRACVCNPAHRDYYYVTTC